MIPMNSRGWFDDLPESMTEAQYRELSEEISRTIEIVHGHVIKCESPVPRHNRIARRLSFALEAARSPASASDATPAQRHGPISAKSFLSAKSFRAHSTAR
jgi:hypothetical protein